MNRADIEIQAIVNGVSQKELLDFFDMFEQVTGYVFDSPFVNKKFMKEKGANISIVIRSLLSQKLPKQGVDKIMAIFEDVAGIGK